MILASLIAAAVAAPAAVYPQTPSLTPRAGCPDNPGVYHAAGPAAPAPRRLDREPSASLYLSVYREVGGCAMPVVLRERPSR